MGDQVSRIGLYCGAVALALSFIMIIGIAANTDLEDRRMRELEARDLNRSCNHSLLVELKCTGGCDTHKRPHSENQRL
jgi:hypothetical protein